MNKSQLKKWLVAQKTPLIQYSNPDSTDYVKF